MSSKLLKRLHSYHYLCLIIILQILYGLGLDVWIGRIRLGRLGLLAVTFVGGSLSAWNSKRVSLTVALWGGRERSRMGVCRSRLGKFVMKEAQIESATFLVLRLWKSI